MFHWAGRNTPLLRWSRNLTTEGDWHLHWYHELWNLRGESHCKHCDAPIDDGVQHPSVEMMEADDRERGVDPKWEGLAGLGEATRAEQEHDLREAIQPWPRDAWIDTQAEYLPDTEYDPPAEPDYDPQSDECGSGFWLGS